MLAPTLITLPAEILSHIFSYLVFKDITIVPPTQSLLPYYQSIIYNSVFIFKESAYDSFSSAVRAKPFLAKLIVKFDIDFRDEDFQQFVGALNLVDNIGMMSQLKWLGLGEVPQSVTALLSAETLRDSLPQLRNLNISEERSTTTTQSILELLDLVSQLSQVEHLSVDISSIEDDDVIEEANEDSRTLDVKHTQALSLYNFDHITSLDIKGYPEYDIFSSLLLQFKYIRSLTLRTFYGLDLAPISSYRQLEELHLLDCTLDSDAFTPPNLQPLLQLTSLKILTIGDKTLFPKENLSRLHLLKLLHTLNLGIEFWSDLMIPDDLTHLILPDSPHRIPSLKNLNFNTRLDYKAIVQGTRWKSQELEHQEIQEWNWAHYPHVKKSELRELFDLAESNKIKIGGQILEVEWPQFDKPRVLGDILS